MATCPRCGYELPEPEDAVVSLGAMVREYRQYGAGSGLGVLREAEEREPVRAANPVSDVLVPGMQAVLSGGLVAVAVAAIGGDWRVVLVVAGSAMLLVWVLLLHSVREDLSRVRRLRFEARDEEGTGDEMEVTVRRISGQGLGAGDSIERCRLPPRRRLRAVFEAVRGGRKWSQRDLYGIDDMSQADAAELLERLHDAGFLRWRQGQRHHPEGAELTEAGRELGVGLVGEWVSE